MSDSNSDASQSQVTEEQDNRIAAAADSVNLVASRSSIGGDVNITSTDHNTVAKSFDFAKQIASGAASELAASSANIKAIATTSMDAVKDAYADSESKIANAYTEAKVGEQKVMVGAGLAIVALVAIKIIGKGA